MASYRASWRTLVKRARYGGRKGRRAKQRLEGVVLKERDTGATITFRVVKGILCTERTAFALAV